MMDLLLYFVFILLALLRNANAHCRFEDFIQENEDCTFNIDCENDMGVTLLPFDCHFTDVTLRIQNTTVETFSKAFYHETNFDDIVTSVKATDNNWKIIAPQAFSFIYCTLINLSNNGIKFIHRDAFLNSTFLAELNLSRNAIEVLDNDSFVISDDLLLIRLTVLDLSHNFLSYIFKESLHDLPQLRTLYLDNNKLIFLSNDAFMKLKNVIVLSLSYNRLTSLQTALAGLNKLEELYLSFNNLHHLHDYELTDAISIKIINMSHNSLETVVVNAFNYMTNLQMLDLSMNLIRLPISIFNNTKLKYLNLSYNRIANVENILVFASSANNLETVDFSFNNIPVIPAGMFTFSKNLKLLNVSSNFLSNLSDGSLIGLKNVTVLDLSNNELLELDARSFKECNNLNELILDFNFIKEIDFDQLTSLVPSLSILSIGSNRIQCEDVSKYYSKRLKQGVNVTSIHEVFDDDNVFGIACDALNFFTETLTWTLLMVLFIVILITAAVWSAVTNRPKSPPTIDLTNFSNAMETTEMEESSL